MKCPVCKSVQSLLSSQCPSIYEMSKNEFQTSENGAKLSFQDTPPLPLLGVDKRQYFTSLILLKESVFSNN